jgi:hypothetical protein
MSVESICKNSSTVFDDVDTSTAVVVCSTFVSLSPKNTIYTSNRMITTPTRMLP